MSASLAANQICRVIFAVVSILVCIVPLCVLTRLGEFAATVFVADVILLNIFTLINASVWRNDDIDTWWDGSGYCDLQVFVLIPLECVYGACIFAIMRNLAQRLRLKRATELTLTERRRQMMYQALIIFPVPLVQLALTWFMLNNRYVVGTLVGCVGLYNYDWLTAIVLDIPLAIFPLATVPFACEYHPSSYTKLDTDLTCES
jgi:pheromone a factor receptor